MGQKQKTKVTDILRTDSAKQMPHNAAASG
jgi:hypothetical protein